MNNITEYITESKKGFDKMSLKKIIRNIFRIHKTETFEDGMIRHYYHLRKKLPYQKISL